MKQILNEICVEITIFFGLKKDKNVISYNVGYFLFLREVKMKMFAFVKKGETLIF